MTEAADVSAAAESGAAAYALVRGEPVTRLPDDLYIPPDALEVFLEAFEGPLDLLLYLIKRQNLDILVLPIAEITRQYMEYIGLMKDLRLELAAEYLVMAAMLAEIKSRMLLPRPAEEADVETDPRAELIRRLQEYERFKQAAESLDALPRLERDTFPTAVQLAASRIPRAQPDIELKELLLAFQQVVQRAELFSHHHVQREPLSVRERMTRVLSLLAEDGFIPFTGLFSPQEGRSGVVVTLLAVLELIKDRILEVVQAEPYAPIYLKPGPTIQQA